MAWKRLTRGAFVRFVNLDNVIHIFKAGDEEGGTKLVFARERDIDQFLRVDQSPEEILGDLAR